MNDLPAVPFKKILDYLSLEDRIRSRAVSRRWYKMIDSFTVKNLCYSGHPIGFIVERPRLVSGAFVQNFISSSSFASFFDPFASSFLFNLKHLRICDLSLDIRSRSRGTFFHTLNSFGQLEELVLFNFDYSGGFDLRMDLELNLPMLSSIRLETVLGIAKLSLNAPRLARVKLLNCPSFLRLDLAHGESIESLIINRIECLQVKQLKNLKYLYTSQDVEIGSTFLSSLEQLKEIHLIGNCDAREVFEQRERYGRADLKIYLCGCLLNGRDDPAIDSIIHLDDDETVGYLAENLARLADEIPLRSSLYYSTLERVPAASATSLVNRFVDLSEIKVNTSVQDVESFLVFLKSSNNITKSWFFCLQPQELYDRLPDHCPALLKLTMFLAPPDIGFLFRFRNLIELTLYSTVDAERVRKVFEELQFLSLFEFGHNRKLVKIISDQKVERPKRFLVSIDEKKTKFSDVNAAIQFVFGNEQ